MVERTIDLDEVERLLTPYTHRVNLSLERTSAVYSDRLDVKATLVSRNAVDQAAIRLACVEAGNGAIAALEAAGYEHAGAPEICIDGIDTPEFGSEAVPYIVDATLTLTLLGKRAA